MVLSYFMSCSLQKVHAYTKSVVNPSSTRDETCADTKCKDNLCMFTCIIGRPAMLQAQKITGTTSKPSTIILKIQILSRRNMRQDLGTRPAWPTSRPGTIPQQEDKSRTKKSRDATAHQNAWRTLLNSHSLNTSRCCCKQVYHILQILTSWWAPLKSQLFNGGRQSIRKRLLPCR